MSRKPRSIREAVRRRGKIERSLLVGDRLEAVRVRNLQVEDSDIEQAVFRRCIFEGCELVCVRLRTCQLDEVRFVGCKLKGVVIAGCSASRISFDRSSVAGLAIAALDSRCCMAKGNKPNGLEFTRCELSDVSISAAVIGELAFVGCRAIGSVMLECSRASALIVEPAGSVLVVKS